MELGFLMQKQENEQLVDELELQPPPQNLYRSISFVSRKVACDARKTYVIKDIAAKDKENGTLTKSCPQFKKRLRKTQEIITPSNSQERMRYRHYCLSRPKLIFCFSFPLL